jgi:hypothetical protein
MLTGRRKRRDKDKDRGLDLSELDNSTGRVRLVIRDSCSSYVMRDPCSMIRDS